MSLKNLEIKAKEWLTSIGANHERERVLLAMLLMTSPTVEQLHIATTLAVEARERAVTEYIMRTKNRINHDPNSL